MIKLIRLQPNKYSVVLDDVCLAEIFYVDCWMLNTFGYIPALQWKAIQDLLNQIPKEPTPYIRDGFVMFAKRDNSILGVPFVMIDQIHRAVDGKANIEYSSFNTKIIVDTKEDFKELKELVFSEISRRQNNLKEKTNVQ